MVELLDLYPILPFAIGLSVGLVVGFILGLYVGVHYRNTEDPFLFASLFGVIISILWAGLHTYAIFSGSLQIPLIFDVVGGLAMGQALGIDLVTAISKFKK